MPDVIYQFLSRAAVMVPAMVIVGAVTWFMLKRFGIVNPSTAPNAQDMRTWPLGFVLAESALLAVVFAAVSTATGDREWSAPVAAVTAAIIAIGLGPQLVRAFQRLG